VEVVKELKSSPGWGQIRPQETVSVLSPASYAPGGAVSCG